MNSVLLDYCRYYGRNVDEEQPNVQMFVRCEKAWIDAIEKHIDYSDLIDEYIFAGLTNFEMYDNTPVLLKAICLIVL